MLYPVCLTLDSKRHCCITAPDFENLRVTDPDKQRALTRIHLLMEGAVSELLADSIALPRASKPEQVKLRAANPDCEVLVIDINPVHLAAVAAHQSART